jgi:hypothetical protein
MPSVLVVIRRNITKGFVASLCQIVRYLAGFAFLKRTHIVLYSAHLTLLLAFGRGDDSDDILEPAYRRTPTTKRRVEIENGRKESGDNHPVLPFPIVVHLFHVSILARTRI